MEKSNHDISLLVEKSALGDMESCKKLYDCVCNQVFVYVRSRTATTEIATDVTQDVFIDFFSTLSKFSYQSSGQFYSYLFTITRRKIASHYREAEKRDHDTNLSFDETSMSAVLSNNDKALGDQIDIHAALSTLDEVSREIIVLHHWSRYTFPEIALLLEMNESAVRVRHHRTLKELAATFTRVDTQ
ncbi:MAG: hypothetical protein RLZZ230_26 [Candidatus Parcubacteria bacterium]|jgi:RNA polymerase sigma-70 factor (ECF subfamily)